MRLLLGAPVRPTMRRRIEAGLRSCGLGHLIAADVPHVPSGPMALSSVPASMALANRGPR